MVQSQIIGACGGIEKDDRGRPLTPAGQTAIEELLVRALTSTEKWPFTRSGADGTTRSDTMIGDVAAEILVQRWGKPQLFDIYATLGARERQRLELRNTWLKKCGKPPAPLPPKVVSLPDDKVRPLLEAVQRATTPETRLASVGALENLGLAGLPAVRRFLRTVKPDDPSHGPLESLARRLALTIEEVRFTEDSVTPSEEVRHRAEAFRGKPVTSERLMAFLFWASDKTPPGARGIRITMERPGDDTGTSFSVTLVVDRPGRKGRPRELAVHKAILRDHEMLMNETLGCFPGSITSSEIGWKTFVRELTTAFQSTPEQYLLVQVGYEEER